MSAYWLHFLMHFPGNLNSGRAARGDCRRQLIASHVEDQSEPCNALEKWTSGLKLAASLSLPLCLFTLKRSFHFILFYCTLFYNMAVQLCIKRNLKFSQIYINKWLREAPWAAPSNTRTHYIHAENRSNTQNHSTDYCSPSYLSTTGCGTCSVRPSLITWELVIGWSYGATLLNTVTMFAFPEAISIPF